MNLHRIASRLGLLFMAGATLLASPAAAQLGAYRVGDVVTNFSLPNRLLWTNDNGRVFTPGNTSWSLHDFEGKIVLFEVFAYW
jgi:hypothetical protein